MSELRKLTQGELSVALKMNESEIAAHISDNEPKPDGNGHWVYFRQNTPIHHIERLGVGADYRLDLR